MSNENTTRFNYPERCSKFKSCNATLCPLDAQRSERAIHRDDPACFYLLEVGKVGAKKRFLMWHTEQFYNFFSQAFKEVISTACPIKKSLLRAKNTPSRMRPVGEKIAQIGVAL